MTAASLDRTSGSNCVPLSAEDARRVRLGGLALWAILVVVLAMEFLAPGQARAASLEYAPETEQRYLSACVATMTRVQCQCRLEALQSKMGMEAFLDAAEAGDEQALAGAMVWARRQCPGETAMPASDPDRSVAVR
ncbi:MAG: hypothetical protein AB7O45_11795 [Alphaproteobacteria bacterium]